MSSSVHNFQNMKEVESGFTDLYFRIKAPKVIWRYAVHHNDRQLRNITVLFRGPPEDILSSNEYGALLVNGKVIDVLTGVDEDDPRVKAFQVVLPTTKDLDINIVLAFQPHDFPENQVRILADVGDPEESNISTEFGSIVHGKVTGPEWTPEWTPKKFNLDQDIQTFVNLRRIDFETRQAELMLGIKRSTLGEKLDELVAWKTQRQLIDDRMQQLSRE
jgi:hypothetical protein